METHLKVLAAVQIVCGALGVMAALVLTLIFGGTLSIVGASGDPEAAMAIPIIGITGIAVVVFLLVLSLPGIVVGIGLWQRRPWARVGGIVLSVFNLFGVPFLTLLGIYGLWVLFSKETEGLFVAPTNPAMVK
jgi:hypothetical protein